MPLLGFRYRKGAHARSARTEMYKTSSMGRTGIPDEAISTALPRHDQKWVDGQVAKLQGWSWPHATRHLAQELRGDEHKTTPADVVAVLVRLLVRADGTMPGPDSARTSETDPYLAKEVYCFLSQLIRYKRRYISRVTSQYQYDHLLHSIASTQLLRTTLAPPARTIPDMRSKYDDVKQPAARWTQRLQRVREQMFTPEAFAALVNQYGLMSLAEARHEKTPTDAQLLDVLLRPTHAELGQLLLNTTQLTKTDDALRIVRQADGGSNVMRHPQPTHTVFLGPLGGSPPGSFAVTKQSHIVAALMYSQRAPVPSRIIKAIELLFSLE